jgi:methylglyoxal/glyoxal reductase
MKRFCHSFFLSLIFWSVVISLFDGTVPFVTTTTAAAKTASNNKNNDSSYTTTTSLSDTVALHDGRRIPVVGLGVALTGEKTFAAVQHALNVGYRLIDTASEESYGNEDAVGAAVTRFIVNNTHDDDNNNKIRRGDIVVTTKLWDADHGFYETLAAMDKSYDALDIGPIDMYLIHSPFRGKLIETWDAILYYQQKGHIKSVGVSNFGIEHLQAIKDSGRPLPTINQIEMHPLVYKYRLPLIEWCRQHDIKIQAYGSIMFGYSEWLENSDVLSKIQSKYPHKTTAQILLRWALQHEFLIIPKSSQKERITSNAQLYDFELSKEDMEALDNWGDAVTDEQRNLYEKDWGWNPIDEASVNLGKTTYWPDYKGVVWDEDDDGFEEEL